MKLEDLEQEIPELTKYTVGMPQYIRDSAFIKIYPPGKLIHQKDCELQFFGILAKGENRVINEFENGKIYMLETNKAIDFIGEVTLLAGFDHTSVTIEAVSECVVIYITKAAAEEWIKKDNNILQILAKRTAFKLYRSSYNNGLKLYYPPAFLLADYLVRAYEISINEHSTDRSYIRPAIKKDDQEVFVLQKIRERLCEELGMNIKTLDRAIRSMHEDGYFNLKKGKISFDYNQYLNMKAYITAEKG